MKRKYRIVHPRTQEYSSHTVTDGYAVEWSYFGIFWKPCRSYWDAPIVFQEERLAKQYISDKRR